MDKKTDKILYSPKEGTSGFRGLRNVPEEPSRPKPVMIYSAEWEEYLDRLESCKSNSLEIVNPEVIPITRYVNTQLNMHAFALNDPYKVLESGDIFDLPEGYEFKEEERFVKNKDYHSPENQNRDNPILGYKEKVLRLVKTETFKERFTKLFPQPKPEESQYWLWDEVDNIFQANKSDEAMRICERKFTIQRKKQ